MKHLLLPTLSCCIFFPSVVYRWLSGVGFGCRVFLSVVILYFVVGCQESVIGCCMAVDCRVSLSVFVVGSWSSGVRFRVLALECRCRLLLTFFIFGPQLCL
jgi:hypothetical protein